MTTCDRRAFLAGVAGLVAVACSPLNPRADEPPPATPGEGSMPAATPWKTFSGTDLGWVSGGVARNIGSGYAKMRYQRTADGLVYANLVLEGASDTSWGSPGDGWTWYLPNELVEVLFNVDGTSQHAPAAVGKALAYDSSASTYYQGVCIAYQAFAQWFLTCYFGSPLAQVGANTPYTWAVNDQLFATLVAEGFGN